MKITLEPTAVVRSVGGCEHREWVGEDDQGVRVIALVRAVAPQTHDEDVARRYAAELRDIGFAYKPPLSLRNIS